MRENSKQSNRQNLLRYDTIISEDFVYWCRCRIFSRCLFVLAAPSRRLIVGSVARLIGRYGSLVGLVRNNRGGDDDKFASRGSEPHLLHTIWSPLRRCRLVGGSSVGGATFRPCDGDGAATSRLDIHERPWNLSRRGLTTRCCRCRCTTETRLLRPTPRRQHHHLRGDGPRRRSRLPRALPHGRGAAVHGKTWRTDAGVVTPDGGYVIRGNQLRERLTERLEMVAQKNSMTTRYSNLTKNHTKKVESVPIVSIKIIPRYIYRLKNVSYIVVDCDLFVWYTTYRFAASCKFVDFTFDSLHLSLCSFHCLLFFK
jgi:hypothetical protein